MREEILDFLMATAIVLLFVALIGFAGWVTDADEKAAHLHRSDHAMMITYQEFLQTLSAHRLMDESLPHLKLEQAYWQQFCFADDGAHYIPPSDRNQPNGWAHYPTGPVVAAMKAARRLTEPLDAERQAHEDFLCDPVFCVHCQEERDLEELISYTLEQLEKEKKRA